MRANGSSPADEMAVDALAAADAPAAADLLVVGAGAKAAAVAAKVHAINTLGLGPVALTIVEGNEPAASWLGLNGMTSGEELLAVPPIKDVGFPYESARAFGDAGAAIDRAVMGLSWQQHLIGEGRFARWVNAGFPAVRHGDFGRYLAWVLSHATAGVTLVRGRVEQLWLDAGERHWVAGVAGATGSRRYSGRALMLTGPGVHRHLPHDSGAAARMFHCDSRRDELLRIPGDRPADVAIVGGGESALSCVLYLRAHRPAARLTVYTPTLPLSRGESFLENRVFADPDAVGWSELDLPTRRAFVHYCDRGVFDAGNLSRIAYDDHCRFVAGRVVHVASEAAGQRVSVDYASVAGPSTDHYDYVVNCTGFDLLKQLEALFPPGVRARIERHAGALWDLPPGAEIRMGRALEIPGMCPRLHIPGLAAVSQGPGFANLGCLGLLANRVLEPCLLGDDGMLATPLAEDDSARVLET
jgi:mycobactin lysine-N-oxygenase